MMRGCARRSLFPDAAGGSTLRDGIPGRGRALMATKLPRPLLRIACERAAEACLWSLLRDLGVRSNLH